MYIMHTSIQSMFVYVLAVMLFMNDFNNNNNMNHHKESFLFCHGFTTTTKHTIVVAQFPDRFRTSRRNSRTTGTSCNTIMLNVINHHQQPHQNDDTIATTTTSSSRRDMMHSMAITSAAVLLYSSSTILPAFASGGATAGRYTTIPIAKRRYYGRVQQAVHEFLLMGTLIVKGDMSNPVVSTFFDVNGIVVVEAKRKDVNGQCTKKDNECKGREIRDSRWNDMKASMYLLGNAFRTDQQKPPDRLPTVKAARAFFKEINEMEKIVKSSSKKWTATNTEIMQQLYTKALFILDIYLDLVELPPTSSGHYDKEFDTLVGETARIT